MGDSILEYLFVGGIFLLSVIQRRKILKILRQNKKLAKPNDDEGALISDKCKNTSRLDK